MIRRRGYIVVISLVFFGFSTLFFSCGGETEKDYSPSSTSSFVMDLNFTTSGYLRNSFNSNECIAVITESQNGAEEVIIYGTNDDKTLSLSIVLNLNKETPPGELNLVNHKVIFAESDISGDVYMIADEVNSGKMEIESKVAPYREFSGKFSANLSGYEMDGEGETIYDSFDVILEGEFNTILLPGSDEISE